MVADRDRRGPAARSARRRSRSSAAGAARSAARRPRRAPPPRRRARTRPCRARPPRPRTSGYVAVMSRPLRPRRSNAPALHVGEGAHTVPLDLEGPVIGVPRKGAWLRQHRRDPFRHQLPPGVVRRIHPVDHPVLAARSGTARSGRSPARRGGARSPRRHGTSRRVGARVPDLHQAAAVLAAWDLALEVEVRERVVLGAHGEPVLARVRAGCRCGSAHDASTPSCSSRRSQCSDVAWCSWITNRRASPGAGSSSSGSGVGGEVAALAVLVERHAAERTGRLAAAHGHGGAADGDAAGHVLRRHDARHLLAAHRRRQLEASTS